MSADGRGETTVSNELRSLLARVADVDPDTAKELRRHIDALQGRRQFGLNFERHMPESVALTGRPISVGDKVRFLPPRAEAEVESNATWTVSAITGPKKKKRVASLLDPKTKGEASRALEDLVFVADFRDPIYPGLKRSGEPVLCGGDKPFHTVINAENYHALEALLFTHRGKVDCIYIDPPYNSGAKDWKYNNDFVDGEDAYRHSKWLAFMERRLKVARQLLNPGASVENTASSGLHFDSQSNHGLESLESAVVSAVPANSDVAPSSLPEQYSYQACSFAASALPGVRSSIRSRARFASPCQRSASRQRR
jgi:adenine-specific DNA-methyltransferase